MINIQAQMKELFGNSCLAYCYAALATHNMSDIKALTRRVLDGWYCDNIEDNGYVAKPVQYFNSMSAVLIKDVVKVPITSLSELPAEGYWIVEFKKTPTDEDSHFGIATRFKVIFDPSGESNTVKNGVPVSYRKLIWVSDR